MPNGGEGVGILWILGGKQGSVVSCQWLEGGGNGVFGGKLVVHFDSARGCGRGLGVGSAAEG